MTHPRGLPFARTSNGRLISIDAVDSGLVADGVCPQCNGELVAKKGNCRIHHFAHHSREECVGALETTLHLAAKRELLEAVAEGVPFHIPRHPLRPFIYRAEDIQIQRVECEKTIARGDQYRRLDAFVESDRGSLAVEFRVTHKVDEEKKSFFESCGLDCIEIDLGHLVDDFFSGDLLDLGLVRYAVMRNPECRSWAVHMGMLREDLQNEGGLESIPNFGPYRLV